MPGNSAGAVDGESMISEEREHVGNLPANVFPISARGGGGVVEQSDYFTCIDKL